jgi:multicomponent Na+:H+ antiporter subunit A
VLSLARGPVAAAGTLRVSPITLVGVGLLLTIGSGLAGMWAGDAYLTHLWWEPDNWLPKMGTTIVFDVGVYLVVLGAVLTYLFGLQREAAR